MPPTVRLPLQETITPATMGPLQKFGADSIRSRLARVIEPFLECAPRFSPFHFLGKGFSTSSTLRL